MMGPCSSCVAQAVYLKGYVIQLTNDTLWGEIKKNTKRDYDNFVKVSYRKNAGNEIKTFGPKKIRSYWVDSLTFVSRMIDEEMVFVKRMSSDTSTIIIYEAQTQYDQMGTIKIGTDYTVRDIYYFTDEQDNIHTISVTLLEVVNPWVFQRSSPSGAC